MLIVSVLVCFEVPLRGHHNRVLIDPLRAARDLFPLSRRGIESVSDVPGGRFLDVGRVLMKALRAPRELVPPR